MKLISTTDFVLSDECQTICEALNYANFLKQPLTLDMFIGYKALFLMTQEIKNRWWCLEGYKSVEDFFNSGVDLTLTPHALKQLGL